MKCPSSEPVSPMVPTPFFSAILERMSPRLSSALLALASAEGLGGRRGGVVRRVGKFAAAAPGLSG